MIKEAIAALVTGQSLSMDQASAVMTEIMDGEATPSQLGAFVTALSMKGETMEEIAGLARVMRSKALHVDFSREMVDIVGTGGDRANTFNISTTAAFVAAGAGLIVAKHGNRAASSRSGSADVLEALGVRIDLTPAEAARSLREHHFAFFFAPNYHPAFKHIAPARKLCAERGQRTIFNFLGPLLNPARPSAMLVGVPRPELCEPLARVLQSLGVRRAMVVCGAVPAAGHLDELSTLGPNTIAEFYQERGFATSVLSPGPFPVQSAKLADLIGGDCKTNAEIVRRILRGEERGPKLDAVLLNAAAALFVAGKTESLVEGWDLAAEIIDDGRANAKLAELAY